MLVALWEMGVASWSIVEFLIAIIIVAACVGITYLVVVKVFGIQIPSWFAQICWIVIAAVVAIFAIRLIAGM